MKTLRPIVSLSIIAALALLTVAFIGGCGKKEFKVLEKRLVTEIDDKGKPKDPKQDLAGQAVKRDEKAIYLWFKYPRLAKARKAKWEITRTDEGGGKDTYGDEFDLKQGTTSAYFGIQLNQGESLPAGDYELMLKEAAGTPLLKDKMDPKKPAPVKFTVK